MPPGIGVNTSGGSGGLASFDSYVEIDARALAEFLRSENGPVMRHFLQVADRVKERAQALVGVDTGNLRDHIVKRVVQVGDSFSVQVGADVDYALYHHEGSDAVEGKLMRFKPKGSDVYIFRTRRRAIRGNPFLVNALNDVSGSIGGGGETPAS